MSTQTEEQEQMGTQPIPEHQWLQNLVGDWHIEAEWLMGPDQPPMKSEGSEKIESFGGLWAFGQGEFHMGPGQTMSYYAALGYDVTLKEYRSCWIAAMSSHLWIKSGQLSEDRKTLTLTGDGPNMQGEGMVTYRNVFSLVDSDHFTLDQYGLEESGDWHRHFTAHYRRK
jgi:hypothetical protein